MNQITLFEDSQWRSLKGGEIRYQIDTPYDVWERDIQDVLKISKVSQRWVGEIWTEGERLFGEKAYQAVEASGYAMKTIVNAAAVWKNVRGNWIEDLPFDHHATVSKLNHQEQKSFLAQAKQEGWTAKDLRDKVRARFSKETARHRDTDNPIDKLICQDDETALAFFEMALTFFEDAHENGEWDAKRRHIWRPVLERIKELPAEV